MNLSPLPDSLSLEIRKIFAQPRLQAAMLDLDHLAALIRKGEEKTLCREWLHRREEEKLQTLHYEKRHLEWLGGRICAKEASLQYLQSNQSEGAAATLRAPLLQIMKSSSGRPFLDPGVLPGDLSMPHISISHSRGYALAVAASTPCGIDIQADSGTLARVKDRFCSRAEEELLGHRLKQLPPSARLTLLWAAKEAVKKGALFKRMPGFLDLALTHIQTTAGDDLVLLEPGMAKERSRTETGGQAHCLFTLDSLESNRQLRRPPLQFLVTVCRHQGYGIGLYVLPSQPSQETDNA